MNAERLLEHYEKIAEAPDAIPKLRRFILDLAVRGKLVPQDPNDEPAEELLKRIEKAKTSKSENVKKLERVDQPLKTPYQIPALWAWTRLNNLTKLVYGKLLPTNQLTREGYDVFGANGIIGKYSKYLYEKPMLLISCRGAYSGTPNIPPPLAYVTNNSIVCEFFDPSSCNIHYMHAVLTTTPNETIVTGTAQPQVTVANAIHIPIPLPPLAEQQRIVAKVDELMGICDRLEGARKEREAIRDGFTTSTLARLSVADESTFRSDASFAIDHLRELTTRPDQIKQLRQTILNLAVRGKLVPQDPNDEAINKFQDPHDPDAPYGLPSNWRWTRIGDQLELINGMAFKPTDWTNEGLRIVRIQNLNNSTAPFNFCDLRNAKQRNIIDDGTFLISWSGTPGTSFGAFIWNRGKAVLNQHIFKCEFKTSFFTAEYLRLAINGRLDEMIAKAHGGVGLQHITKSKLESLLISLPPLPEQHRVVSRFNELSALCERLETSLKITEEKYDKVSNGLLEVVPRN